jgi:hypothetical protein
MIEKWAFLIVFYACSCVFSAYLGWDKANDTHAAAATIQAAENAKKLSAIVKKTEEETKRHYERYIRTLKSAHKLPDSCQLSADFRRLHDDAAGVSEVTAAQTVAARTVADTMIKNYAACNQNAIWLKECNEICQ